MTEAGQTSFRPILGDKTEYVITSTVNFKKQSNLLVAKTNIYHTVQVLDLYSIIQE